jgi:hypothetical protein
MSCADGCRRDDVPEGRVTSCPMAVKRRPVQRQRRAEALPLGGLDLSVQRCLLNRPAPSPCEPADLDAQAARTRATSVLARAKHEAGSIRWL